jgi:hypothetical protein
MLPNRTAGSNYFVRFARQLHLVRWGKNQVR